MSLNDNIVYGLERLADVFKSLLWDKAKTHGISPIQIQLLLFIANHDEQLCNVTHLAREFNVTKPTISDAIKVLEQKEYVKRYASPSDGRRHSLSLTVDGGKLVDQLKDFASPLKAVLLRSNSSDRDSLYTAIVHLISDLNRQGLIPVQRTCFGCRFYQKRSDHHYCNYLKARLKNSELRLDCPEHQAV